MHLEDRVDTLLLPAM